MADEHTPRPRRFLNHKDSTSNLRAQQATAEELKQAILNYSKLKGSQPLYFMSVMNSCALLQWADNPAQLVEDCLPHFFFWQKLRSKSVQRAPGNSIRRNPETVFVLVSSFKTLRTVFPMFFG